VDWDEQAADLKKEVVAAVLRLDSLCLRKATGLAMVVNAPRHTSFA
jgi:hypothetical protein